MCRSTLIHTPTYNHTHTAMGKQDWAAVGALREEGIHADYYFTSVSAVSEAGL